MTVKPIPKGFHTITPYLVTDNVDKLLTFIENAFNATITERVKGDDGKTKHAEAKIGDSMIMAGFHDDELQNAAMLYLYVEVTDATYQKALTAGGMSLLEPSDQFYGDRNAGILGPCGNRWRLATRQEVLSHEELEKRSKEFHKKD